MTVAGKTMIISRGRTTGLTVTGCAESGSTITYYDNGTSIGTTNTTGTTCSGSGYVFTKDISLSARGNHNITVTATHGSNLVSGHSDRLKILIDTTAPTVVADLSQYYSDPDFTDIFTDSAAVGDNIYTRVVFNDNMARVNSGGSQERPIIRYKMGDTTTTYDMIAHSSDLTSGTCHATGGGGACLDIYVCLYTIQSGDTGTFSFMVNSGTEDRAGNTLASAYTDKNGVAGPGALGRPDLHSNSDKGRSNTDNLTNHATPTVTGGGANSGASITLTARKSGQSNVVKTTTANSSGNYSATLGTLGDDGDWLVSAVQTVSGTKSSPSPALTITIDTTNPKVAINAYKKKLHSSYTRDTLIFEFFHSEPIWTRDYGTYDASRYTLLATDADGRSSSYFQGSWNGRNTIRTSPIEPADNVTGSITYKIIKYIDLAGNTVTSHTSKTVSYDSTVAGVDSAPLKVQKPNLKASSDTGSADNDNVTDDNTPTVDGSSVSSGANITLYALSSGQTMLTKTTTANSAGKYSATFGSLADDVWLIYAVQKVSGKNSPISEALQITITDDVGESNTPDTPNTPNTPSLKTTSDSGSSNSDDITNDDTPTITGDGADSGATITLTARKSGQSNVVKTATANSSGNYSATLDTLGADGDWLVNAVQAVSGTNSSPSSALTITIDTSAPTVNITSDSYDLENDDDTTVTVTFSEAVTGFASGELTASAGAWSDFTGSGKTYTATYEPPGSGTGTATISVAGSVAKDTAGNNNTVATDKNITYNTGVVVIPPNTPNTPNLKTTSDSGSSDIDDVTNDDTPTIEGDGAASGATITLTARKSGQSNVVKTATANSSGNYSATLGTLGDDGDWLVSAIQTVSGTNSSPSSALTITIDTTVPTVNITPDSYNLANDDTTTVTVTFSEAVTGFASSELIASAGNISSFTGSGKTYTATYEPPGSGTGTATISVAGSVAKDTAGNNNTAATDEDITYSETMVVVDTPNTPNLKTTSDNGSSDSDDITNDDTPTIEGDGAASGATITLTARKSGQSNVVKTTTANSSGNYSATLGTLGDDGDWLVSAVQTVSGTNSNPSSALTITIDTTAPIANITPDSYNLADGATATVTVTFSEAVTGFASGELIASAGNISSFTGFGKTYTATYEPPGSGTGTATISVAGSVAKDTAGNNNTAATDEDITYSETVVVVDTPNTPNLKTASDNGSSNSDDITNDDTPTITGGGADSGATITLTARKSGQSNVTKTTTANSSGNYSATLGTLSADGDWLVSAVQTVSGTNSSPSSALTITIDTTAPIANITPDSSNLANGATTTVTVTFSEAVTGFASGELTASAGAWSDFTGSGKTYTATYEPPTNQSGIATISVAGGVAKDTAGNNNNTATDKNITYNTVVLDTPNTPSLKTTSDSGSSDSDNITNDDTPTIEGDGVASGATITLTARKSGQSNVTKTTTADSSGNYSATLVSLGDDGDWLVSAVQTVSGTDSSSSSALTITIDTTFPTLTDPDFVDNSDRKPELTITVNHGQTFSETLTPTFSGENCTNLSTDDITGSSTGNKIYTLTLSGGSGTYKDCTLTFTDPTGNFDTITLPEFTLTSSGGGSSSQEPEDTPEIETIPGVSEDLTGSYRIEAEKAVTTIAETANRTLNVLSTIQDRINDLFIRSLTNPQTTGGITGERFELLTKLITNTRRNVRQRRDSQIAEVERQAIERQAEAEVEAEKQISEDLTGPYKIEAETAVTKIKKTSNRTLNVLSAVQNRINNLYIDSLTNSQTTSGITGKKFELLTELITNAKRNVEQRRDSQIAEVERQAIEKQAAER